MFDSHGFYGQPGLTAQQFLPHGFFGAAPSGFAPYGAFGNLPGPYGQSMAPSTGGWPGQFHAGAFAPPGLMGILQGQQGPQLGLYPQLGQPPVGYPFGGWPGQQQPLTFMTPQGLVAILPGQLQQQIGPIAAWLGQQLGSQLGAPAGRGFLPYQVPAQLAYA